VILFICEKFIYIIEEEKSTLHLHPLGGGRREENENAIFTVLAAHIKGGPF
jgi:hypothetical protein